jgi:hypothetical protein
MFNDRAKLKCLERELALRRHVYAKRQRAGLMPPEVAAHEIAIMQEIIRDYEARLGSQPRERTKERET